jgi:hypothetical protein
MNPKGVVVTPSGYNKGLSFEGLMNLTNACTHVVCKALCTHYVCKGWGIFAPPLNGVVELTKELGSALTVVVP